MTLRRHVGVLFCKTSRRVCPSPFHWSTKQVLSLKITYPIRGNRSESLGLSRHVFVVSGTRKQEGRSREEYVGHTMIEHGRFLQSLRRLRRELLNKHQGNASHKNKHAYDDGGVGPESSITRCSASLPPLDGRTKCFGTAINGEMD